jgi:hypothetical protein
MSARGRAVTSRRELLRRSGELLGWPPEAARPPWRRQYGSWPRNRMRALIFGDEAPDTRPVSPRAAPKPNGRVIDVRAGLWRELQGVELASHALVFIEGAPTHLVGRTALLEWAALHVPELVDQLVRVGTRPEWIVTVRAIPSWAPGSIIVGALRVIVPPRSSP